MIVMTAVTVMTADVMTADVMFVDGAIAVAITVVGASATVHRTMPTQMMHPSPRP